jgi:hypothetical protein
LEHLSNAHCGFRKSALSAVSVGEDFVSGGGKAHAQRAGRKHQRSFHHEWGRTMAFARCLTMSASEKYQLLADELRQQAQSSVPVARQDQLRAIAAHFEACARAAEAIETRSYSVRIITGLAA